MIVGPETSTSYFPSEGRTTCPFTLTVTPSPHPSSNPASNSRTVSSAYLPEDAPRMLVCSPAETETSYLIGRTSSDIA